MGALGTAVAFSIGTALAKYIAKTWVGSAFFGELTDELIDLVRDKGEKITQQEHQIDQLASTMASRMKTVYEHSKLPEDSKRAVAIEVATTLAKTRVDVVLVISEGMDPTRLAKRLLQANRRSGELFSADEVALYERLIFEAAHSQVQVSSLLESFPAAFAAKLLNDNASLASLVEKVLQEPAEEIGRFQTKYKDLVKKKLDRLEIFGIPELDRHSGGQSLSIAYISLEAEPDRFDSELTNLTYHVELEAKLATILDKYITKSVDLSMNRLQALFDGFTPDEGIEKTQKVVRPDKSDTELIEVITGRNLSRRSYNSIESILSAKRRVVIQGQAGSGKTTLLQWLAVRSASGNFPKLLSTWNQTIPFFIRLREYVDTGFPLPHEFPEKIAPAFSGEMPHGWVHKVLDSGLGLVLVDGVDELPIGKRDEMLERLSDLVQSYPASRYVVSSRPAALKEQLWPQWSEWVNREGFTSSTLRDMDGVLVASFIDHWHEARGATTDDEEEKTQIKGHAGSLKSLLNGRPPLRRIAKNPLLCAMICALYQERQQNLPNERLKLYEECVEMLLSRRDEGRRVPMNRDYPSLELRHKLRLIQDLAYWMVTNDYSDVEAEVAEEKFSRKLPELGISDTDGQKIRQLFVERTNLLREPVVGRIDFTHLTFQEYLAAKEAVDDNNFGVLKQHILDDKWRELIVLAIGIARPKESENFLRSAVAASRRKNIGRAKRKQIALLALACLETCASLPPSLREEILENASSAIPPSDADEAKLVASAGDPAVPLLAPKDSYSIIQLVWCIRTLSLIGSERAMRQMAAFSGHQNGNVIRALVAAWDSFDRVNYARVVLRNIVSLTIEQGKQLNGVSYLHRLSSLTVHYDSSVEGDLAEIRELPRLSDLTLLVADTEPDYVLCTNIASLRKLRVTYRRGRRVYMINDLRQFGRMGQLTHLSILGAAISASIDPLAGIRNLAELSLGTFHDYRPDFGSLSALESLRSLEIHVETEFDIRSVTELRQLERLAVVGRVDRSTLHFITGLTNLIELSLPVIMNDADLTSLHSLTKLANLTFTPVPNVDFATLKPLSNLKTLKVISVEPLDLDTIPSLNQLTLLDLTDCVVHSYSPIARLENLQELTVRDNEEVKLGKLRNKADLRVTLLHGPSAAARSYEELWAIALSTSFASEQRHLLDNLKTY